VPLQLRSADRGAHHNAHGAWAVSKVINKAQEHKGRKRRCYLANSTDLPSNYQGIVLMKEKPQCNVIFQAG
jgi:hypothetical protein